MVEDSENGWYYGKMLSSSIIDRRLKICSWIYKLFMSSKNSTNIWIQNKFPEFINVYKLKENIGEHQIMFRSWKEIWGLKNVHRLKNVQRLKNG